MAWEERIIKCAECGAEVLATHNKTKFCPECGVRRKMESVKRSNERISQERKKNPVEPEEPIHLCDSPEKIQMCLNCQKAECNNCLRGYNSKRARKEPVYFESVREELIECVRKGMTASVMARKLGCNYTSIRKWKQRLEKEGVLE